MFNLQPLGKAISYLCSLPQQTSNRHLDQACAFLLRRMGVVFLLLLFSSLQCGEKCCRADTSYAVALSCTRFSPFFFFFFLHRFCCSSPSRLLCCVMVVLHTKCARHCVKHSSTKCVFVHWCGAHVPRSKSSQTLQ